MSDATRSIEACFMAMVMGDSRYHGIIDEDPCGREILSALYGRYGYKYPDARKARAELLTLLRHPNNPA